MAQQDALSHLSDLTAEAGSASDVAGRAAALAELQRASASALRETVQAARDQGVSWRELARILRMAAPTLYGQFQAGHDVVAVAHQRAAVHDPDLADPDLADRDLPDPDLPDPGGRDGEPKPPDRSPSAGRPGPPAAGIDLFVGRQQELADLRPLLARSRLVTLVGPAGVGKTRLAAEFIPGIRKSYPAGVWWAELAPLLSGAELETAVARAVGARPSPEGAGQAVANSCGRGAALLVLDNCEHLLGACAPLISSLLAACPRLRVLATSREEVGIPAESLLTVAPLATPPGHSGTAADVRHLDSVRLFADRARAVCPGLELTDELLPVIGQLCAELDGLPLAIELAARLADVFTPQQMLGQLGDRLTLLTGRRRDAPLRHRSLKAAIEWSYDLLAPEEQATFRRLAILPGGCNREIASAVCADLELSPDGMWAVLTGLRGKCLLVPETAGRFRMLDSLRAFGLHRLEDAGELTATQGRLLAWLTDEAQSLFTDEIVPEPVRRRLDRERHNLSYAVRAAEQARDSRHPVLAYALAAALRWHGEAHQAEVLLQHLLTLHSDGSEATMLALAGLADVRAYRGDYHGARQFDEKSLDLARRLGHQPMILQVNSHLAHVLADLGDAAAAVPVMEERVTVFRTLGRPVPLALSINSLAWTLLVSGQLAAAEHVIAEAMPIVDAGHAPGQLAPVQHTAGTIALLRQHFEHASVCYTIALLTPLLDPNHFPYNLDGLALVAANGTEPERALRLFAAADASRAKSAIAADPWWRDLCATAAASARTQLSRAKASAAMDAGASLTAREAVAYALSAQWPQPPRAGHERALTARERQVAALLVHGFTNSQIGARLGITPRTVASHLEHIRTKLDLPTRAHVIAWATREINTAPQGSEPPR